MRIELKSLMASIKTVKYSNFRAPNSYIEGEDGRKDFYIE